MTKIAIIILTGLILLHYFFFLFGGSIIPDGINTNFYIDNNITLEKKGVWGDFTSGHFSVLAFLWLAYGIFIQSKEFKLQRDEFENQTEQFREQNLLYAQQMRELEIQSIQNQFDRKIIKLTEIEKTISNQTLVNNDIQIFIDSCIKQNNLDQKFEKIKSIEKYINLYNDLLQYVKENEPKIDLSRELSILKKDIYDGLKISYMILLWKIYFYIQRNQYSDVKLDTDTINNLKNLKIYHQIKNVDESSNSNITPLSIVKRIINNYQTIDQINIFEKQV